MQPVSLSQGYLMCYVDRMNDSEGTGRNCAAIVPALEGRKRNIQWLKHMVDYVSSFNFTRTIVQVTLPYHVEGVLRSVVLYGANFPRE